LKIAWSEASSLLSGWEQSGRPIRAFFASDIFTVAMIAFPRVVADPELTLVLTYSGSASFAFFDLRDCHFEYGDSREIDDAGIAQKFSENYVGVLNISHPQTGVRLSVYEIASD
jgi:hypothetical protein